MSSRRVAAVAVSAAAFAVPATASAHDGYNFEDPSATASDGHYVVSLTWNYFECPAGYLCGDMMPAPTCVWSDGSVDHCEDIEWWNWWW
jgi:hypothetical protein